MPESSSIRAVSFDFGQTLAGLDAAMLQAKLASRGAIASVDALDEALPSGWAAYDQAVRAGVSGHPWKLFMTTVLEAAGCQPRSSIGEIVDFLWDDQPRANLWRSPIEGMMELCRDLNRRGVPIGVLTNSEGRASELLEELGWRDAFKAVIDSGRIGFDKPDPRIFHAFAEAVGVPLHEIVHVGDNFGADVQGALGAGLRAIWFGGRADEAPAGVPVCHDARGLRAALATLGLGALR